MTFDYQQSLDTLIAEYINPRGKYENFYRSFFPTLAGTEVRCVKNQDSATQLAIAIKIIALDLLVNIPNNPKNQAAHIAQKIFDANNYVPNVSKGLIKTYSEKINEKLLKQTLEKILCCIKDNQIIIINCNFIINKRRLKSILKSNINLLICEYQSLFLNPKNEERIILIPEMSNEQTKSFQPLKSQYSFYQLLLADKIIALNLLLECKGKYINEIKEISQKIVNETGCFETEENATECAVDIANDKSKLPCSYELKSTTNETSVTDALQSASNEISAIDELFFVNKDPILRIVKQAQKDMPLENTKSCEEIKLTLSKTHVALKKNPIARIQLAESLISSEALTNSNITQMTPC